MFICFLKLSVVNLSPPSTPPPHPLYSQVMNSICNSDQNQLFFTDICQHCQSICFIEQNRAQIELFQTELQILKSQSSLSYIYAYQRSFIGLFAPLEFLIKCSLQKSVTYDDILYTSVTYDDILYTMKYWLFCNLFIYQSCYQFASNLPFVLLKLPTFLLFI